MRLKCFGFDLKLSPSVLNHAQDAAWSAARRFARRVASVTVQLIDAADHLLKCCRIEALIGPGDPIVVEATDADPMVAIDMAAARFKEALAARLCQRRPWKRQRVRKPAYRVPLA